MLECKELSYKVSGREILHKVSLTARDGEITVLVGNNGSGKTTLIRSITAPHGLKRQIEGKILVDGADTRLYTPRSLAMRVALLPQTLPTPKMTVEELVTLGTEALCSPFSRISEESRRRVKEEIASLGLERLAGVSLDRLSGGERQSAYFAMLLSKRAKNLILDEPDSNLDAKNRARLFSFLSKMKASGHAILTVLHDITDAVAIADRIVVLDSGSVIFSGTPSEFERSDIPRDVFSLISHRIDLGGDSVTVYRPISLR